MHALACRTDDRSPPVEVRGLCEPADAPGVARPGLPPSETTVARVLRDRGYATGVVGKWHLGRLPRVDYPLKLGFNEFFGFLDSKHSYFGETPGDPGNPLYRGGCQSPESQYLTRAFAREAVDFIQRHAHEPFFLYLPFNATHLPLQAEPEMLARFAGITDQKRRVYAAMLAHLDEAVGEVVRTIHAEGLAEDTLIVFLGDNGCIASKSSCRNAPLRGGKYSLLEGGIRVPFLLSWEATFGAGQIYRAPVSALDLFPTMLAAATGSDYADARLDGVNLLPYLTGQVAGTPHSYLFWGDGASGAVRRGDWKLLDIPPNPIALYNLRKDIKETKNVASLHGSIVNELRNARRAWTSQLMPPLW